MNNTWEIFDLNINICLYLKWVSIIKINCEIRANMLKDLLMFLLLGFELGKTHSSKFMSHSFNVLWENDPSCSKHKIGFFCCNNYYFNNWVWNLHECNVVEWSIKININAFIDCNFNQGRLFWGKLPRLQFASKQPSLY